MVFKENCVFLTDAAQKVLWQNLFTEWRLELRKTSCRFSFVLEHPVDVCEVHLHLHHCHHGWTPRDTGPAPEKNRRPALPHGNAWSNLPIFYVINPLKNLIFTCCFVPPWRSALLPRPILLKKRSLKIVHVSMSITYILKTCNTSNHDNHQQQKHKWSKLQMSPPRWRTSRGQALSRSSRLPDYPFVQRHAGNWSNSWAHKLSRHEISVT